MLGRRSCTRRCQMKLQGGYLMLLLNGKGKGKGGLGLKIGLGPLDLWLLDPLLKFKMRICKTWKFFIQLWNRGIKALWKTVQENCPYSGSHWSHLFYLIKCHRIKVDNIISFLKTTVRLNLKFGWTNLNLMIIFQILYEWLYCWLWASFTCFRLTRLSFFVVLVKIISK